MNNQVRIDEKAFLPLQQPLSNRVEQAQKQQATADVLLRSGNKGIPEKSAFHKEPFSSEYMPMPGSTQPAPRSGGSDVTYPVSLAYYLARAMQYNETAANTTMKALSMAEQDNFNLFTTAGKAVADQSFQFYASQSSLEWYGMIGNIVGAAGGGLTLGVGIAAEANMSSKLNGLNSDIKDLETILPDNINVAADDDVDALADNEEEGVQGVLDVAPAAQALPADDAAPAPADDAAPAVDNADQAELAFQPEPEEGETEAERRKRVINNARFHKAEGRTTEQLTETYKPEIDQWKADRDLLMKKFNSFTGYVSAGGQLGTQFGNAYSGYMKAGINMDLANIQKTKDLSDLAKTQDQSLYQADDQMYNQQFNYLIQLFSTYEQNMNTYYGSVRAAAAA